MCGDKIESGIRGMFERGRSRTLVLIIQGDSELHRQKKLGCRGGQDKHFFQVKFFSHSHRCLDTGW